jgi:hypothetical protein
MKSILRALTFLVAAVLSISAASAQFALMTLKFNAPFAFNVAKRIYPAGDYFIERSGPNTLSLRDGDHKFLTLIETLSVQSVNRHANSAIRFEGEQHALAEVWQGGSTIGYKIYVPHEPAIAVAAADSAEKQNAAEAQSWTAHSK